MNNTIESIVLCSHSGIFADGEFCEYTVTVSGDRAVAARRFVTLKEARAYADTVAWAIWTVTGKRPVITDNP